ncbi:EscU/YscU/HrcU family type III secretion system export apparatus switch protein [Dactylosporangium aurantiacum]|uniref:EscU/YscU/HrcU family type III secretion system export apparatus switch protein n=1 Tax=Dactylosporangium aurantiacum TaxID=35754 RepID=A0A9Q9MLD5_9ACTN|nr:EscU/YscU/HrcU family type III secretion system export apparatus switch protein [Dactylosporangium aurantiacum]MDG6102007.1 EscU/YscU/HrcU family type III secretion system export apparatus switch protein [Dactylosporangium aurantiacum]UWZ53652.1 EscU/YscU/HrcU family type III secretion system export apparatus switch protein [Dactylosporangium aurantiacum]
MAGEKTEQPTEQKKRQARREGTRARTPDLGAWGGVLLASVLLPMTARNVMSRSQSLFMRSTQAFVDPEPAKALELLKAGVKDIAILSAPITVGLFVFAILATAAQGGLRPATKLLKPDFKKLNPFKGLKRTFGGQAAWESVKSLVKVVILGLVVYNTMQTLIPTLLGATAMPLQTIIALVADTVLKVIRVAAATGLALAFADYFVAKRRVNKQLRMSKEEVKEEHKKSEGDPHVKGQIRQRQHEMARSRMMADVPRADVVVVNPTHVSVALRYDPTKGAPRVVAKGMGVIALKIREVAGEHRVPMVEDVPLARALYGACDVGDEIPAEFFGAVARVLAFIMMLKSKGSAAGVHTVPEHR